ncbi:hypothetical protein [Tateyamaria sp. SN6-1]|uniref:hypothetical protein n=1 Tax=Tateyamaria sp. SN6-1 TaxID=3092148 RepID=UPI0039F5A72C
MLKRTLAIAALTAAGSAAYAQETATQLVNGLNGARVTLDGAIGTMQDFPQTGLRYIDDAPFSDPSLDGGIGFRIFLNPTPAQKKIVDACVIPSDLFGQKFCRITGSATLEVSPGGIALRATEITSLTPNAQ